MPEDLIFLENTSTYRTLKFFLKSIKKQIVFILKKSTSDFRILFNLGTNLIKKKIIVHKFPKQVFKIIFVF